MAVICPHCEREIDVPEIVELVPDQTPPKNPHNINRQNPYYHMDKSDADFAREYTYEEAQQDMIRAGWRRIKC